MRGGAGRRLEQAVPGSFVCSRTPPRPVSLRARVGAHPPQSPGAGRMPFSALPPRCRTAAGVADSAPGGPGRGGLWGGSQDSLLPSHSRALRGPPGFQGNRSEPSGSPQPPHPRTKSRSVDLPRASPPGASPQGYPLPWPVPSDAELQGCKAVGRLGGPQAGRELRRGREEKRRTRLKGQLSPPTRPRRCSSPPRPPTLTAGLQRE